MNKLGHTITLTVTVALTACASEAKLDQRAETALAAHRTTCLKRGLAVDTPEHAKCVAALYEREQLERAYLRNVVTPETKESAPLSQPSPELLPSG